MLHAIYISHDTDGTPATALLTDYLEEAIGTLTGNIACTGLPGYAPTTGGPRFGAEDAGVVIGVVIGNVGAAVARELRSAQARGVDCFVVAFGPCPGLDRAPRGDARDAPDVPDVPHLSATRTELRTFAEDVAYLLEQTPRLTAAAQSQLDELAQYADAVDGPVEAVEAVEAVDGPVEEPGSHLDEPFIPWHRPSMVVPKRRWPTFLQALEAGLHMNAHLIDDANPFERDRAEPEVSGFDEFLRLLEADRQDLARLSDKLLWQCALEDILESLPVAQSRLGDWYEVGVQLISLCRLSSTRPTGKEALERELARNRRRAWDALCHSAFMVNIRNDELGEMGSMLHRLTDRESVPGDTERCLDRARAWARRQQDRRVQPVSRPAAFAGAE